MAVAVTRTQALLADVWQRSRTPIAEILGAKSPDASKTAKSSQSFNRSLLQSRQMPNARVFCRNPTTLSATEPEMLSSAGVEVWSLARDGSLVLGLAVSG